MRGVTLPESLRDVDSEVDIDAARHFETGLVHLQITGSGEVFHVARAENALVFQQRHFRVVLDGARKVVRDLAAPHAAAQCGTYSINLLIE